MEAIIDAAVMFIFTAVRVFAILGPAMGIQILAIITMFIAHFVSQTLIPVSQFPVLEFVDGWRVVVTDTSIQLPYHIVSIICACSAMAAIRRVRPQSLTEAAMAGIVGIFAPPLTFALMNIIISNINNLVAPLMGDTAIDIWRMDLTDAVPRMALLAVVSVQGSMLLPIGIGIFLAGGYWGIALTFVMKMLVGTVMTVGVPNVAMEIVYGASSTDFKYVARAIEKLGLCVLAVIFTMSSIQLQISSINTAATATLALARHYASSRVLRGINDIAVSAWEEALTQDQIEYIRSQPADNCESPSETGVSEHCSQLLSTLVGNVLLSLLLPVLNILLGVSSGFVGWVILDQLDPRKIIRETQDGLAQEARGIQ